MVLFAHGTWPEGIDNFTVVADGSGEEKCELGKLNPSRRCVATHRKNTVMFTSKYLFSMTSSGTTVKKKVEPTVLLSRELIINLRFKSELI